MTDFLDREDVIAAGRAAIGHRPEVADVDLLDAAVARPRTTVGGQDAYPDLWTKAAALLQSIVANHALMDGNKRTAWAAAWVFLHLNGHRLAADFDVDDAEDLMIGTAAGRRLTVTEIAVRLQAFAET